MTAPEPTRHRPRLWKFNRWWWLAPAFFLALPLGLSWLLTAPLSDHPVPPSATRANPGKLVDPMLGDDQTRVVWPDSRIDGEEAKRILLKSARRSVAAMEDVEAYTATFRRQERVSGVLGPEIVSALKIRNHPFAIYLKYLAPKAGKEVVYAEGHHDNKVIAHNGDWTRRLIPRLAVAPDSALALADSRHPVTDAGLLNLSRKLLRFRVMDMGDDAASTVLDRFTLDDGRQALRSFHSHAKANDGRPFYQVEVLYDSETQIPFQIKSYDWPTPDHRGELNLAESYTYENLNLKATLTAVDFDPANPDYDFTRF